MCELQVGPDVELHEVRAGVDRDLQRRERVLGCDRRRATMADDDRRPVPPPEVHVFLITTIAQSSPRFAARIGAAGTDDGVCDLLRGPPGSLGEQRVETLAAEEVGAAPRLDHAVGVEDDGRPRWQLRPHLVVRLRRVDAEREAAAAQRLDATVGKDEPRFGMPGARAVDGASRVDQRGTPS